MLEGRNAFGCSRWKEGCEFRMPKVYRGIPITPQLVAELCTRGIVLRPIAIEGSPRILVRTALGEPFDIEPPSRDAQRPGVNGHLSDKTVMAVLGQGR